MLQYNLTPPAIHFLSNQLHILAIQSAVLQYNFQSSSLPLCNTKMVLQYNFFFFFFYNFSSPLSCNTIARLAIQLQGLQYKFTIQLGSSPKTVSALIFFFHYNIYLHIFHYFQQLEKITKITKNHFFFFNTQINLQKFIFFIFFSSFTPCKTLGNYFVILLTK